MGRIYRQASVVRAWLGPEQNVKVVFAYLRDSRDTFSRPDKELVLDVMRHKLDPIYVALREFYKRPYFRRRWIIQEVALAVDVICHIGSLELPWDALSKTASNVRVDEIMREGQGMPLLFSDIEYVLATVKALRSNTNSRLRSPVNEMMIFRHSQCFDDKDRVLALMGYFSHLWVSSEHIKPQIDDGLGNCLNSIYTFLSRWQLRCQIQRLDDTSTYRTPAILDLFSIACVTRSFSDSDVASNLPSWVPDWRCDDFEYDPYSWSYRLETRYGASSQLFSGSERKFKWPFIKDPDHQNHLNTPVQLIDYIDTVILLSPSSLALARVLGKPPKVDDDHNNKRLFQSVNSFQTVCAFLRKGNYHTDQICWSCHICRVPGRQRIISIDVVTLLNAHLCRMHVESRLKCEGRPAKANSRLPSESMV